MTTGAQTTEAQTFEHILTERRGRVGVITLHRPERLNALNYDVTGELKDAILAFDADPEIGAIVLTGAGRAFSAGWDVKSWGRSIDEGDAGDQMARAAERVERLDESMTELCQRVKPMVVAYNGDSIGAGLTITIGCDYRLASEKARLSMRFAAMGILPELESTRLLAHIVGLSNALDLMITGKIVDAEHALRIGLVSEVVPHDELLDRAVAKAEEYARVHPDTTRAVKQLVRANLFEPDTNEVRRREMVAFAAAQKGPAHKEAVRAFIEKRQPDFYSPRD